MSCATRASKLNLEAIFHAVLKDEITAFATSLDSIFWHYILGGTEMYFFFLSFFDTKVREMMAFSWLFAIKKPLSKTTIKLYWHYSTVTLSVSHGVSK